MTVMTVVSSYDSYRVKVTHVSHYNYSTTPSLYLVILYNPKVLIIYFLIFVLCISLAISYALIMLFEVIFVF